MQCPDDGEQDNDFSEAFSLPDLHPIQAGATVSNNLFDDEPEEEMIQIVNPNKHVQNYEDGGRRRKLRHVSKIETFKRGKDAIKSFCKDLFSVKQMTESTPTPLKEESMQSSQKKSFSQILEERNEESPPFLTDQSMHSTS